MVKLPSFLPLALCASQCPLHNFYHDIGGISIILWSSLFSRLWTIFRYNLLFHINFEIRLCSVSIHLPLPYVESSSFSFSWLHHLFIETSIRWFRSHSITHHDGCDQCSLVNSRLLRLFGFSSLWSVKVSCLKDWLCPSNSNDFLYEQHWFCKTLTPSMQPWMISATHYLEQIRECGFLFSSGCLDLL